MTKVSVIIPTLPNNQKYLDLCVRSLFQNTKFFDIELLIAENGEGTNYPQGQCAAVNRVAKRSTGEWIMVTNDDMYFATYWNTRSLFGENLCWSPNLVEPVEIGSAPPFLKLDAGQSVEDFNENGVCDFSFEHFQKLIGGEVENGFNLPFFMRRDLWETIGGYDEFYDPWGSNSDTDLQTKVEIAGVTPVRRLDCLVYHFGSKSESFTPEKQEFWWQNFNYYRDKFGYTRDDEPKANTWYCKNMINREKLIYHPDWEGQYGSSNAG